jgi:hypothetical protein
MTLKIKETSALSFRNNTPSQDPDLHPLAHQEAGFAELSLEHQHQVNAGSTGNS